MSVVFRLLRLKLQDLLAARGLLLMLLVLPPLLGWIAGSANMANDRPQVTLALVDEDNTAESAALLSSLIGQGWQFEAVDADQADRLLLRRDVDGIVTIRAGYAASLLELKDGTLSYQAGEGSLVTTLVREAIAAEVLPEHSRRLFIGQLEDRLRALGQPVPDDLEAQFNQLAGLFAEDQARLDVVYVGAPVDPPALSYLMSDYAMEVFFLSIYAVLGTLMLSGQAIRRRLAATRDGLMLDYALSVLSVYLVGLLQILFYTLTMLALMGSPIRLRELYLLAICLGLMLGIGQLAVLVHEQLRLYVSLTVLLLLSVASGCFFQMSEKMITGLVQYLPQGWTLAALRGYPVLPAWVPVGLTLVLLSGGYQLQLRRTRQLR